MNYSDALVDFVKAWEGFKPKASGDPLVDGVRDIGYGHVLPAGSPITTISEPAAEALLREDFDERLLALDEHIHVTLAQHEQDALLSLAYNIGVPALVSSTLLRRLNNNRFDDAAAEFRRWNRAGGRIVPGLTKRREAERRMFVDAFYGGRP